MVHFYGTTFEGGSNGDGVIFNATTNGSLTTLFSFLFFQNGFLPSAGLAQAPDGEFFGTTFEGGTNGDGTIFAMSPGGVVTTRHSFTGGGDGSHPAADLIQGRDGNFYGSTVDGGAYGDGTIFRWTPDGALATLVSFDGYDGANPQSPLVQGADGNLYGTALNGGAAGNGTIFQVNINSPSLQITGQPASQSLFFGDNAVFSVAVTGNPPLFYQWQRNGTNLLDGGNISGSSARVLTVSDIGPSDSSIYSVIVSNAAGSTAVSSGAFLQVRLSPPQFTVPLADQTASVGGSVQFTAEVQGDLPLFFQWQSNQVNLTDDINVSGSTTASLTLSGLTQRSNATYTVIASNAAGVSSEQATLSVFPSAHPAP